MFVGRFDETIAENKRAQELDPLSPEIAGDLAYNYMVLQHYDDSILQYQKAIELEPNAKWLQAGLAWTYARKGDLAQAIVEYQKMRPQDYSVSASNQLIAAGWGWINAVAGKSKEAQTVITRFNELSATEPIDPYWVAAIYSGLGDKRQAFEFLEKSYRQHSGNLVFLKSDPFVESLRSDSRYADLLRRIGLPS
jgi:tetratricopeptide (TPR) repeat protein